jgi:glycosyltransferase involved in cell wall biosynthesis
MRILVSHPYYWPYVRRGSERFIHGLSQYLSGQGHQVEIVTSKPGRTKKIIEGGITINYLHEFRNPLLYRFGITPELSFMPNALYSFLLRKYDMIHSFFYSDSIAASICKKFKNIRYVMTFAGVPIAACYKKYPVYNYLINKAFKVASVIIVASEYSKNYLWEDYKKDGVVIPGTVDLSKFYIAKNKDLDQPRVLCTAALTVPWKNVALLVKAFELFKTKVPKAILQLSGQVDYRLAKKLIDSVDSRIRTSIHILGVGTNQDLSKLYAEAAFTVLPSIREAFGSVLIESLASGTPVVGTESGGIPEIITDPKIGVLYKPNKTDTLPTNTGDLCDAMCQALELAKNSKTPYLCRQHASKYDWSVVGPKIEEIYKKVSIGTD